MTARDTASTVETILARLEALGSERDRAGMARFGINTKTAYGVSVPTLRQIARKHRRDTPLARALWATGCHEARILSALIADPKDLTRADCDAWVADVNSWDLCDQLATLFQKTPFRDDLIADWTADEREFVRREGFVLIVARAVHDKKAAHSAFPPYFDLITRHARDERNFVKKAVNWALRQIGKRAPDLYGPALDLAEALAASDNPNERWIGRDAMRDLRKHAARRNWVQA